MKKLLLVSVVAVLLCACKQSSSPKETAQDFLTALYTADLTTASDLASSQTKALLNKGIKESRNSLSPEDAFQFATLTETMDKKSASVQNEVVSLNLLKEKDGWKVVLDEQLLSDVQTREETLAAVQVKWLNLVKEYEGRLTAAKEYIRLKKAAGALSPQAKTLYDLLDSAAPPTTWTKETLLAYVAKQQQLKQAIDAALEPSRTANTDMTMNYFLQIANANDRIKVAEGDYEPLAEKAHSPVYVPLSYRSGSSSQAKNN